MTETARWRAAQDLVDRAVAEGWLIRFINEAGSRCVIELYRATPEQIAAAARLEREEAGRKTRG